MKRIIITESQKDEILKKYSEADDKLLIYLRRNFPVVENPEHIQDLMGKYRIMIDDKSYSVVNNFNSIVNRIDNYLVYEFPDIEDKKRRQTIKKYVKHFEN